MADPKGNGGLDIGTVQLVDIDQQMRSAYLDYAMSVIVARALPDARDGLKPVHRRILYAMYDMGIRAAGGHKKSARIVGEVLGKYHPHGDMAVYDAMARLAQDFSLRYPLIDGQGNFGSVDGDAPAAMRYTEARLARLAEEMLLDIDKETVDFADNFDGTLREPVVLPSRLPNLLLNGSSGIAVGMATNVPPHNLRELASAIGYLIDRYDEMDDVTVEELMQHLHGPDFPTGGVIVGTEGILSAYATGRGRIVVRGVARIEEMSGGRFRIVISEIPYQIGKSALIERIAELSREGRIDSIADLRDESDRRGMSIVLELKRTAAPRQVLNQLYKYTMLQSTFGVQVLALVEGEPRLLNLKRALQIYIQHRQGVLTRRSQFDLARARARAHVLDGLLIALSNLDAVIKTIRESKDAEAAKGHLMQRFKLSEIQAQAILDMQLRRLAALERQKIEDEHKELLKTIAYLEDLLAHPKKILALIKKDLEELSEKYGDDRRTRVAVDATEELREEDLVRDEAVVISITQRGYIKRVPARLYRTQGRGGKGAMGHELREEDEVTSLFPARSLDSVLFFSDRGKVYSEKAHRIPEAERADRGSPIANVLVGLRRGNDHGGGSRADLPGQGLLHHGHAQGTDQARRPLGVRVRAAFRLSGRLLGGGRHPGLGAGNGWNPGDHPGDGERARPALRGEAGPGDGPTGGRCECHSTGGRRLRHLDGCGRSARRSARGDHRRIWQAHPAQGVCPQGARHGRGRNLGPKKLSGLRAPSPRRGWFTKTTRSWRLPRAGSPCGSGSSRSAARDAPPWGPG